MKRKNSICKTLQKSKTITHSYKQNKKTIKKSYTNEWKDKTQSVNNCVKTCGNDKDNGGEMVQMVQRKNGQFVTRNFPVRYDREVFNFPPMIPNVPIIEMELDNDCESEWPEIEECVHNMTMSLSLAMFDRKASMKRKDLVWFLYIFWSVFYWSNKKDRK